MIMPLTIAASCGIGEGLGSVPRLTQRDHPACRATLAASWLDQGYCPQVHADPPVCGSLPSIWRWGDPHHAQCAFGVLYNTSPSSTILGAYHIEVGGKIVGETQTKALSAYHALFAATTRPRPGPSPAPQYAKHIGETVRVLTGPCTGHIGEITAIDGPSPITFRVQFAAPVRCAEVGEVQAVWRQLDQLVFIDESV
jgi:hypothetical protein